MPERAVHTWDCAIALCIPLTQEAFFADLDPLSPKDFVKTRASELPGMTRAGRWLDYEPLARTALQLEKELQPYKVELVPHATLADFGALLERRAVVTLVAHWRFAPLQAGDILDLAALTRKLAAPRSPTQRWIAAELERRGRGDLLDPRGAEGPGAQAVQRAMAREIQGMLDAGRASYVANNAPSPRHPPSGGAAAAPSMHLTRAALEGEFPDEIRPGAAVEFHDGLRTVDEIIRVIPPSFDGVLDLTVCNSILLGESIRRRRRDGFMMICNQRRAAIQARLIRYKYIIKALACHPNGARFTDVVADLSLASLERWI